MRPIQAVIETAEAADLIGFPLLDSIELSYLSPEPVVFRAPGSAD